MCILVDPLSFGGSTTTNEVTGLLRLAKIPTITICKNDDIGAALAQRPI
jgi:hypothetical protein